MAIVIEEERKNGGNILAAFGWLAIIVILGVAGYYLFFVPPPAVIVPPPASFANIQTLSQINITPQDITSSTFFQALKAPIPLIVTSSLVSGGQTDPFLQPQ